MLCKKGVIFISAVFKKECKECQIVLKWNLSFPALSDKERLKTFWQTKYKNTTVTKGVPLFDGNMV